MDLLGKKSCPFRVFVRDLVGWDIRPLLGLLEALIQAGVQAFVLLNFHQFRSRGSFAVHPCELVDLVLNIVPCVSTAGDTSLARSSLLMIFLEILH